jgi:hypothetical protein
VSLTFNPQAPGSIPGRLIRTCAGSSPSDTTVGMASLDSVTRAATQESISEGAETERIRCYELDDS